MTAIVDYRAGNLTSVRLAFAAIGETATVTDDPAVIAEADRVVFPGVGAAKSAMENFTVRAKRNISSAMIRMFAAISQRAE